MPIAINLKIDLELTDQACLPILLSSKRDKPSEKKFARSVIHSQDKGMSCLHFLKFRRK